MADNTTIEWTDTTWNPTTGCTKVSPGCDNCYAERIVERFHGKGAFETVVRSEPKLFAPFKWRKPRKVFVNSMSDLFHEQIPDDFIAHVFSVMARTPQHTYQLLTKRHGRMRSLLNRPSFRDNLAHWGAGWPLPNLWVGVSVENQQWADIRIPALLDTPAAVRWLSCEPLLGPVDLTELLTVMCTACSGIGEQWVSGSFSVPCHCAGGTERALDWVVVGGESGPGARPMRPGWARKLRDQCSTAGVPFFFKQWGEWAPIQDPFDYVTDDDRVQIVNATGERLGRPWRGWKIQDRTREAEPMRRYGKKHAGRELDGRTWDEFPAVAEAVAR